MQHLQLKCLRPKANDDDAANGGGALNQNSHHPNLSSLRCCQNPAILTIETVKLPQLQGSSSTRDALSQLQRQLWFLFRARLLLHTAFARLRWQFVLQSLPVSNVSRALSTRHPGRRAAVGSFFGSYLVRVVTPTSYKQTPSF